MVIHHVHSNSF